MRDILEGVSRVLLLKILGITGIILIVLTVVLVSSLTVTMKSGHDEEEAKNGELNGGAVCNVSGELNREKFNAMVSRSGAIKDKGDVIIEIAKKEGIDPVLMLAIIINETGWGKSSAIIEHNNPAGLMRGSTIIHYPTLDDGLRAQGRTLHNLIIGRGLTTIEKLGSAYAPVGASNDPNGLNNNWVPTVTSFVKQAGGLTMNCTANDNMSIEVGKNGKMNYFDDVLKEMLKYKGNPYVWGGSTPMTGFDCSGLMQWSFGKVGIKLPRTALEQYNATKRISAKDAKVGDLVFFRGTYGGASHVSHVGIYVGGGKMFNSNNSGIEYSDITKGYWAKHSPEFGRIK
ncbi:NlpC/P60 family protein [Bacillus sonorensis]|uniref:C40 family peptidase n=1 Tax=Bacillus subtilis group TaxID=653685 RepID=UPI001FD6579D|nr:MULTISPECIES: NlpC/P60 family protein [Bacillus subtilis group]MCJ8223716.1 NlpC/P60 family protein [Bacillus paralicheniformis]MEC0526220.1 NlpC/P60 family protein [Bacillus sonorensis]